MVRAAGAVRRPGDRGPYYLGVDAGNSKTVALLVDANGSILGRGRSGNGDIYGAESEESATGQVLAAADQALDAAGLTRADLAHAAFRLAGVDWSEDDRYWREALATAFGTAFGTAFDAADGTGAGFSVRNDGYALLRCGRIDGVGVAVTAGTGPAVAARGPDGTEWCASWWIQRSLGGRELGAAAFRAVVEADLGLARPTLLTRRLLQHWDCDDVETLLHAFTRRDHPIPALEQRTTARLVLQAATDGDPAAELIVARQVADFADLVVVAAERTGLEGSAEPVPIGLGGSVLTSELPIFRQSLIDSLTARLGRIEVVSSSAAPVAGATLDALVEAGVEVTSEMQRAIVSAAHPEEFLLT